MIVICHIKWFNSYYTYKTVCASSYSMTISHKHKQRCYNILLFPYNVRPSIFECSFPSTLQRNKMFYLPSSKFQVDKPTTIIRILLSLYVYFTCVAQPTQSYGHLQTFVIKIFYAISRICIFSVFSEYIILYFFSGSRETSK